MILHTMNALLLMAEESVEHGGSRAGFILEEVSDHVLIKLPTVLGVDLSITKMVLMMWIAAAFLIVLFGLSFRKKQVVPKGWANFLESIVVYLRDDILHPYLGENTSRFSPYILTAFFFILICNLLGVIPMGTEATSNVSVTATLAVFTFLIGQGASLKKFGVIGYIKKFVPPNIPLFVIPIIFIAEVMGLFTKHFALAIRLFANMIADHLVVVTVIGLIIIFNSYAAVPISLGMGVAVELLVILIAFIQAYIFTMLSAVFIGLALEEEH
ncbi:MAG: F0F1 ATP synthase subunit A [Calditrichaeota bacterium]|nr:F0F1 ATP synthase subunit A [Calditrichota bacterium]